MNPYRFPEDDVGRKPTAGGGLDGEDGGGSDCRGNGGACCIARGCPTGALSAVTISPTGAGTCSLVRQLGHKTQAPTCVGKAESFRRQTAQSNTIISPKSIHFQPLWRLMQSFLPHPLWTSQPNWISIQETPRCCRGSPSRISHFSIFTPLPPFPIKYRWIRTPLGAIAGAVFFAAAGPRATQLGHQQLQWQLFPMLALIGLYRIFQADRKSQAAVGWLLLSGGIIAQFYGGFYSAWFLILGVTIAAMLAISVRYSRKIVAEILSRDMPMIVATTLLTVLLLAPAARHYLAVKNDLGGHPYEEVRYRLATPASWIFPGPFSIERAGLAHLFNIPPQKLERAVSLGLLTTLMAIAGLWIARRSLGTIWIALTGIAIVLLGTGLHDRWSLWWIAYNSVPGAEVIRAPVRIGLLLLIPAALGVAHFVDHLQHRRLILATMLLICLIEQAAFLPSYDKQQARNRINIITVALPADAKSFFYVGSTPADAEYFQIDAMWAALQTGIPTVNGYSGSPPLGWDLANNTTDPKNPKALSKALTRWSVRTALDPSKVVRLIADDSNQIRVDTAQRATPSAAVCQTQIPLTQFPNPK